MKYILRIYHELTKMYISLSVSGNVAISALKEKVISIAG
jgi:hypothetical protein